MKLNWKLRLQNKATLVALASAVVVFVAQVAQALGLQLPVTQEQVMAVVTSVLTVLAGLGVVTDPTTAGVSDSKAALTYEQPKPKGE